MRYTHPVPAARPVSTDEARALLEAVLEAARRAGPRGVVVFDLDSTLLDNRPRQARILSEYGERAGLPELARCRADHWVSWDIADAMRNAGLDEARIAQHHAAARAHWKACFFTSPYCRLDEPVDGAVGYAHAVAATAATVAYVTGRHLPMRDGTVESFARGGLPLPEPEEARRADRGRVVLLMKPTFEQTDDDWKIVAQEQLGGLGEVIAAFDNEPAHANGYAQRYPRARVVHLATDHSGRPIALAPGVVSIADFVLTTER